MVERMSGRSESHGQDGVPYLIQFFVRHVVGGQDRDAAGVQVFAIVGMDVERLGG